MKKRRPVMHPQAEAELRNALDARERADKEATATGRANWLAFAEGCEARADRLNPGHLRARRKRLQACLKAARTARARAAGLKSAAKVPTAQPPRDRAVKGR